MTTPLIQESTFTTRHILACAALALLVLLYGGFRYAMLGMERSRLPETLSHPVTSATGTLATFQAGDLDGRPVVFVHGTPGAADNWAHFLSEAPPGFRIIALDRPGFGNSTPRVGLPALAAQAAVLKPLLESLRGRRPILVGHSLGGPIICQAALDFPDLVGGLVIVAGSLDPGVEKVFAIQHLGDLPCLREIVPRVLRNSNHELIPLREDLERLFPRLPDIDVPVSIIHGTEDMLVPFDNVAYMDAAFAPGVIRKVVVLPGENHFLPWTAPDAIWMGIDAVVGSNPSA